MDRRASYIKTLKLLQRCAPTWASLTGHGKLLYYRLRGVPVIICLLNPPVGAISKQKP